MKSHFKNYFCGNTILGLFPFKEDRRPLNISISLEEIQCAIKTMNNNCAAEADEREAKMVR